MRVEQEKVRQFHEHIDYPRADKPTLVDHALEEQRFNFILEELDEYLDATERDDIVGIADALADLLYVVLGTAVVHGIDLQPVFDAVHASNMTKSPSTTVGTFKGCFKGEGYRAPQIAELLLLQSTGLQS